MSSYGNYVMIRSTATSKDYYTRRGSYSIYKLEEFLSTKDPVRVGFTAFPNDQLGGSVDTEFYAPKVQGTCMSPRGIAAYCGQTWHTVNENRELPGYRMRFIEASHAGDIINNQQLHPEQVLAVLASKGYTRPNGLPLDNTEPQAVCYSNTLGYVWMTIVSERVFITSQYDPIIHNEVGDAAYLDFRSASCPQGNYEGISKSLHMNTPVDSIRGKVLVDADSVVDLMRHRGVRNLTCTLAAGMSIAGTSYSGSYNLAEFTLVDGNQARVQFIIERSEIHTYVASGDTPRRWAKLPIVYGGSATLSRGDLGSMIQIGPNNWGQLRFVKQPTGNHIAVDFKQDDTALGNIVMTTTGVTYNTTSDVRLKHDLGRIEGALSTVTSLVETGAVRTACFKHETSKVMPMFMAQRLEDIAPYAVSEGHGEVGDTDFVPKGVDYSVLMPLVIQAVYDLKVEVDKLKAKLGGTSN